MRKCDDRGFSLVELLVAIAILGVIIVPLLHSFVTAANTNAKAKRVLQATTAGEDVFEELKAADLDTYLADATKNTTSKKDVSGNDIVTLTKAVDVSVNGNDYHTIVTLDPTSYTTEESAATAETDYNSALFAQLSNLSASNNAILTMKASDTESAISNLLLIEPIATNGGVIPTEEERIASIRANLKREILIKVSHSDATDVSIVTATVTYTDGAYTYTAMDGQEIYNNGTRLDNQLSNVFLCFYPMYNNTNKSNPTETITIENTGNYKIGVYLAKQTGSDTTANAIAQGRYSVGVNIKEGGGDPATSLVTNLAYTEGAVVSNEMQLSYTGVTLPAGTTLTDALNISAGSEGLKRAAEATRIYDVTIEVYKEKGETATYEAADLLTTLTGTKIQ